MIVDTQELLAISGCYSVAGLKMWLRHVKLPYFENGNGNPQVHEHHMIALAIAKDTFSEILNNQITFKREEAGVYLLKWKGEVVYVGMSRSLFGRMGAHVHGEFKFDAITFIQCDQKDAPLLETELIHRHLPKYNKSKMPK